MAPQTPKPYESDRAYLDDEFCWIRADVALLDAERRLGDAVKEDADPGRTVGKTARVAVKEIGRRLAELKAEANSIRADIDNRLAVQNQDGSVQLGLDILCAGSDLGPEERKIVLFLLLPAISAPLASDLYAGFGLYPSLTVGEVLQLLRPQGVGDWLKYRRLFHVSAPLVRKNVVALDWPSKIAHPGDLLNATVTLTPQAFAIAVGEPDLVSEGLNGAADGKK